MIEYNYNETLIKKKLILINYYLAIEFRIITDGATFGINFDS